MLPAARLCPAPWQAASAAHSTQRPPAERRCPAGALPAYIRPLGTRLLRVLKLHYKVASSQLPAPHMLCLPRNLHTEVHTVLWLPRNLHMEAHKALRLPRNPHLEVHTVLRLPRNLHIEVHTVLRLPRNLHMEVHTVLRLLRNLPMEVHKVLRLPRNLHIKRRCPTDARAYIRPLGKHQAPHTARKCYRQSAGAQPTPGRTSDPLASSKRRTQYANATGRVPAPSRRQGVHPTPWQAAHGGSQSAARVTRSAHGGSQSTAPATKSAHEGSRRGLPRNLHIKRRCPADARAYIRPLGKQQAPHAVHMEVHKVLCLPRDLHTEVHKVLRLPRNLHMKVHKVLRLPRNLHIKRRCPADARAYIRPLGKQQGPHTVRKC